MQDPSTMLYNLGQTMATNEKYSDSFKQLGGTFPEAHGELPVLKGTSSKINHEPLQFITQTDFVLCHPLYSTSTPLVLLILVHCKSATLESMR